MKTIVALFLACFATALFGQAPPIQRNPFTTNTTPDAQAVVTNIDNLILVSGFQPQMVTNRLLVWQDPIRATNAVNTGALRIPAGFGIYGSTQVLASARPTLCSTGINGQASWYFDGGDDLVIEGLNAGSLSNGVTVIMVSANQGTAPASWMFSVEGPFFAGVSVYCEHSIDYYSWHLGVGGSFDQYSGMTDWTVPRIDHFNYTGTTFQYGENGFIAEDFAVASLRMTNTIHIGSFLGNAGNAKIGWIGDVLIYDGKLNVRDFNNVISYLRVKYKFPDRNLVFIGDSITFGTGSAGGSNYPAQVAYRLTGTGQQHTIANLGVFNQYATQNLATVYTNVALALNSGDKVVLELGINDSNAGAVSNVVFGTVTNISKILKGSGAQVIVLPLELSSLVTAQMTNVNLLLNANWPSFSDAFLYQMFFDTRITNGSSDGLHPASQGYAAMADWVAPWLMHGRDSLRGNPGATFGALAHWGTNDDNGLTVHSNGNVGINTNSPGIALDVLGSAGISGTATSLVNQAKFYSPLAATASRVLFKGADGFATNVTSADPANEYVHADGTTGTPSGSGIPVLNGTGTNTSFGYFPGTTNSPLVIRDTNGVPLLWAWTNSSGVARWYLGSNFFNAGFVSYDPAAARLSLASSNGVRAINLVPNSGVTTYVGIGTLAPASDLDIGGGTLSGQTAQFTNYANPINIGVGSQGGIYFSNVATGLHIKGMAFSGTELFAHTNGNVGFGTNAPAGTLSVQGTLYANNIGTNATPVSVLGRASDGKISEMAVPLGSTQAVVIAAGNGTVTNQVTYLPRLMDGRTNSFQIDLSIGRRWVVTNVTGLSTNVTFQLTNVADGNEYSIEFDGNSLGTNFTVNVTLAAGGATTTNIDWQSPTNGNFTLTATTNQAYKITGEVASTPTATNIVSRWATTDPNPIRGMSATVSAGFSPSNMVVGGGLYRMVIIPAYTNLTPTVTTYTNAAQVVLAGNSMSNTLDSQIFDWRGKMLNATSAVRMVAGYETVIDTGAVINTNTGWQAKMTLTRTGPVGAHVDAEFSCVLNTGAPFLVRTNFELSYTNGAINTNGLFIASNRSGGISNNWFEVEGKPATK